MGNDKAIYVGESPIMESIASSLIGIQGALRDLNYNLLRIVDMLETKKD